MTDGRHTSSAREAILGRWLEAFLEAYPDQSARFFGTEGDAFSNPIGATARRSLADLVDYLFGDADEEAAVAALAAVVRLRAVQEIAPGRSLAFLTRVKAIADEELADPGSRAALPVLAARADALLLRAFDSYVADRERIFTLRAREARSQVHSLLRQAGLVVEMPDPGAAGPDPNVKGGREE